MLIENALKHNKLSESRPLKIRISTTDESFLYIENNLQVKTLTSDEKTGFGLENIRRRYWLLARKEIELKETEKAFIVGLPLIIMNK